MDNNAVLQAMMASIECDHHHLNTKERQGTTRNNTTELQAFVAEHFEYLSDNSGIPREQYTLHLQTDINYLIHTKSK